MPVLRLSLGSSRLRGREFISLVTVVRSSSNVPESEGKKVKPFSAIPSPGKLPLIGHLHMFGKWGPYSFERLYDAYEDLHRKYGPIVRLQLGVPMVALFDPKDMDVLLAADIRNPKRPPFEALKQYRKKKGIFSTTGLVNENDEEWRRLRAATNFMMVPSFAASYFSDQEEVAQDFVERIRDLRDSRRKVEDFLKELYRYSGEAIGMVCFGSRLGLLDDSNSDSISAALIQAADDTMQAMADTLLGFPWWKFFDTPTYTKLTRAQDFFYEYAMECMQEALAKLETPELREEPALQFLKKLLENPDLRPSDVGLLMTEIFSAGIDATGNAIGFFLYNITKRPDLQDKLYEEIQSVLASEGKLTYENVSGMRLLRQCIKESHRLSPTGGGVARILQKQSVLSGYLVPENVLCVGLNPVICRQEEHFEDALKFKPERWQLDDETSNGLRRIGHPYCVLPFSHGVRRCVGQRFAEMEMKLCIIKILQNFRITYEGPAVGRKMRMLLIPDRPLNFIFVDRHL